MPGPFEGHPQIPSGAGDLGLTTARLASFVSYDGCVVTCTGALDPGDGDGGTFTWREWSVATVDGEDVLGNPALSRGRWLRITPPVPDAFSLTNDSTSAAIAITQTGTTSSSSSVGGAINLNNTDNPGAGVIIYSAHAAPTGRLFSVRANNATFSQPCIYGETTGTSFCAKFSHTGTTATANCVLVESTNTQDSSLGVTGYEAGRGTIKVTHNKPAVSDANASCISLDIAGAGTAAKGLFIDSSGVTTGLLVDVRNNNLQKLTIGPNGVMGRRGSVVGILDAATTATVTFGWTEPDANYIPVLSPAHITGAADPMSALVIEIYDKTTTAFSFRIHTAPGVGTQRNFAWRIERNV